MVSVQLDEAQLKQICKKQIGDMLREYDAELVFWDAAELQRRTQMSWNTIQDYFFFDPRFPKRKLRGKWYFPARQARDFLEAWLDEQA
ncbi:group-specific protein [Paenibacillus humicus]|uniref:group-specific protein n=1 Tax=Paenibacillus humicus TaxID=412861 RepID=UPI003F1572BE